jgi:hypothetical protein
MRILLYVSLIVSVGCCFALPIMPVQSWHYHSFDVAMQRVTQTKAIGQTELIVGIDGVTLYNFLKTLYDTYNPLRIAPGEVLKIPKIIHQIWLGSPVPDVYKEFMQTWIETHVGRGWEYKLWTDETINEIILYNQRFYDDTDNFGIKSDLLRWEVLYTYGGLYVDMDYECLCAFDALHYIYDFYTGIQPLDSQMVQLGAALVGSRPGHPILKHCIESVKDHWHLKGAPKKTGPVHFTQSFYAMAGRNNSIDIAFPALYVYPLGCVEKITEDLRQKWIEQGSCAVHWWSKSWMPKNYRPPCFRSINNAESTEHWND